VERRRIIIYGPQENFMTKRMLIDAAHPEETRVVIVDGTRVEELDFESRNKRQLRGNVYLAKVTRVEPSLQAAFIDYGGNRHGFLAFSEIHPDYYQIPYEDKLALQKQDEEELAEASNSNEEVEEDEHVDPDDDDAADENDAEVADEQVTVASHRRKQIRRRRYKIQEVIKRGQILLVQAVKEERGNKGAAMTTYMSLAGRYCVLMPNTPRGGGISRKIANGSDRKRLKSIMDGLSVPQGMGVIVRTAGAKRTKAEITRDYSYLSRLWDDIRDTTLKSVAPALIHEEGNLVKRSIRDLYNKDIEEILVQGEEAYKNAKAFIKMLMPSHAKFVKRYDDHIPLYLRYDVERQIENSLDATVQLKSGGYLVIHPTEALVSVDVNSGKSTKERNVERTALKTNVEAAEELARQMRLRDLAGLIVVDFIDMDESKNNRTVENKMKAMLTRDRARIQTSRISQFGLMEISRQRRRRSLLEGSTASCQHCGGVGRKRTIESAALAAIRAVEEFAIRGKAKKIRLKCPPDVALYLLNEKRDLLTKVDENADVFTIVEHDENLIRPSFTIEIVEKRDDQRKDPLVQIEKEIIEETKRSEQDNQRAAAKQTEVEDDEDETEVEAPASKAKANAPETKDDSEENKPRRRRGRRGGRNRKRRPSDDDGSETENSDGKSDNDNAADAKDVSQTDEDAKPRRRRRRRTPSDASDGSSDDSNGSDKSDVADKTSAKETSTDDTKSDETSSPRKRRSRSRRKAPTRSGSSEPSDARNDVASEAAETPAAKEQEETPQSGRRRKAPARTKVEPKGNTESDTESEGKPARRRRAPAKAANTTAEATPERDAKPARRRKAPAKTATKTDDTAAAAKPKPPAKKRAPAKAKADTAPAAEAKPARRRKAPAKAAGTADDTADAKPAAKMPAARRKAPARAKAPATSSDGGNATPKPARKRAAPKAAAAKPDAAETTAAKPKRKAPVRKAPAKAAAVTTEKTEGKPAARRKAPARKAAPKAEPEATAPPPAPATPAPVAAKPAPETAAAPADDRRRKAPPKRKRGLLDRLMGKE
jgi:ribonuclease E